MEITRVKKTEFSVKDEHNLLSQTDIEATLGMHCFFYISIKSFLSTYMYMALYNYIENYITLVAHTQCIKMKKNKYKSIFKLNKFPNKSLIF